jgi:hypothetical protein
MTPAGRNAHKHVATGSRETAPADEGRHVEPRHKASRRRQVTRLAAPAVFALSVAGTLVAVEASDSSADIKATPATLAPIELSGRTADVSRSISRAVSRSAIRPLATAKPVVLQPTAVDHEFATVALNLRTGPSPDAARVRTVPQGTRLAVTGESFRGWSEVLVEREDEVENAEGKQDRTRTVQVVRWVNGEYLAERKPAPPEPESQETSTSTSEASSTTTTSGLSSAPCPDGSSIESGITSSATRLYRAVCAAFPALTTYGGYDPHGEHIDGRAIDFMVTDSALGQAVADYLLANASTLGVRDIIWAQRIWTPEQASSGWRYMEDRGSATANHYDHVHVAVY